VLPTTACVSGEIQYALAARAVADAVQHRRCTPAQLMAELTGGPMRGSALLRVALAEVGHGIRSAAEADLRDLIRRVRLPIPVFNPRLCSKGALIAVP
jgi:hypothetical protein